MLTNPSATDILRQTFSVIQESVGGGGGGGDVDFRKVLRLCLERRHFQGSNFLKSKEFAEVNYEVDL